jgi:phenylacetate-CoA ligase
MKRAISRKNLWESAPTFVRQMIGTLLEPVPSHWLLGRTFIRSRQFIREAQTWTAEQAREYQLSRLRPVLQLAYDKAIYYRRSLAAAGFHPGDLKSLDDLARLPTLDRNTVVQHIGEMCTKSVRDRDVDYGSTGGTGGMPLFFYMNAGRSAVEYAYLVTSWERVGYRLAMPMAVLRGRRVRADRTGLYHEYDPILRHHYYSVFHASDEHLARYLRHMKTLGPCFLHVYPSSVAALAQFIRRTGTPPPSNVRGVIAESEMVYPAQRAMVEETFGCRYFSGYGHSEKLVLAAECEGSTDYHVWPTYGYFELLDEQGRRVTRPGQRGEIVGTGFMNPVMPFIRYRTGDWATYVADRCEACGRQHTLIRDIGSHRIQEVLVTLDGSEISWTALNMHDDTFLHVRQFQFLQEAAGRAVLRVVPDERFGATDMDRIRRQLGDKLDGRVSLTIEPVPVIPLSGRGKAIYVDQRIRHASGEWRVASGEW